HRLQPPAALDDAAPQGLAEREGRLGELLEEVVRVAAPVDVAGGDLGPLELLAAHRQLGAVVGEAPHAGELAGPVPVEHHHLAAAAAIEPAMLGTARGKASVVSATRRRGRARSVGVTLASVVISARSRSPCVARGWAWLSTAALRAATT